MARAAWCATRRSLHERHKRHLQVFLAMIGIPPEARGRQACLASRYPCGASSPAQHRMDLPTHIDPSQFVHIRMVLSMVVSLSIARLLSGLAKFVQHPGRTEIYGTHLLWALYMLVQLIHFWWWQFALSRVPTWHFLIFAFVIGYAAVLYLLCALLFPDDIAEYRGYADYFLSRRRWFFAVLALSFVLDVVDSLIKGMDYLRAQGPEYGLRIGVAVVLCAVAARVEDRRFHLALVLASLAYQASWILRLYDVLE